MRTALEYLITFLLENDLMQDDEQQTATEIRNPIT